MNPLLIMALLTAASTAANYQSQKKVDKTRANAMAEEGRRRKAAEARASESARSTTQLLTDAGKNQDAKAAEIEARYASHAPTPGAVPTSAQLSGFTAPPRSTLTVASDQRALDRSRADTSALAKAKSTLNAYGDVMVDSQIGAERNRQDIERENTGVRNWAQYVLPAKLNRANAAGQDWSTLADALQLAAAIYGPIGLSKVPAAAGGGAAANVGAGASGGTLNLAPKSGLFLQTNMGYPPL